MGAVWEVLEFTRMELRRAVTSSKGLVLILLYALTQTLGGILFAALQQSPLGQIGWQMMIKLLASMQASDPLSEKVASEYLSGIPPSILFAYYFSLLTVPALVLLMGFDQVSGELAHRSVRYVAFRARRTAWVVGKALGQAVLLAALSLASNLVVLAFAAFLTKTFAFADDVTWVLHLWALTAAYGLAYVSLVTLVSSAFREPFLALGVGASALFGLWVLGLLSHTDELHNVRYVLPGFYANTLLNAELATSLGSVAVLLGFGLFFLVGSVLLIRTRDL
jgi:ABC-2 type transport system permease protein